MSRIRVIWVGKTAKGFPQDGVDHYLKRIRPYREIECVDVRPGDHSGRDPVQALRMEGEAILKRIDDRARVILLDERGTALSSPDLARWLEERPAATFVIGGAYGIDGRVVARADDRLSLSKLTLPHQLVRIVLLEQLYRAFTLQHGHAYHHG